MDKNAPLFLIARKTESLQEALIFSIKQVVQLFHRILSYGSFCTCSLLICDILTKVSTEICRELWSVLWQINFSVWPETNLPFFCFLLQMRVPHWMGRSLPYSQVSLRVTASVQCNSDSHRWILHIVTEYNAHAGLIILVAAFLIYPNTNRREKLIPELWNI